MPSSTPIPDEAVVAVHYRLLDYIDDPSDLSCGTESGIDPYGAARDVLEEAYPHLLAVFSEQLLGDEAVEAAVNKFLADRPDAPEGEALDVIRQDVREVLEATLSEVVG